MYPHLAILVNLIKAYLQAGYGSCGLGLYGRWDVHIPVKHFLDNNKEKPSFNSLVSYILGSIVF